MVMQIYLAARAPVLYWVLLLSNSMTVYKFGGKLISSTKEV
jgi:hypothetical protein